MSNTGWFNIFAWARLFAASLLLLQGYAWGECHFGYSGEGGTSTIVNTLANSPVYFKSSSNTGIPGHFSEIAGPFNAQLSPGLWSQCDAGNEGEQMSNITYDVVGTTDEGYALWPTNIDGIAYAVRVYSDSNPGAYFQYSSGQWINLPINASKTDHNWKIQIKLYQRDSILGNPEHVSVITPQGSKKIGGMSIGGHTDSDNQPWWFNITPSSFSIPVAAATCQAAMVNGGSNNVDFGEVMFSDVKNSGWYPHKQFNLQLKGCANTVGIYYKVSSNTTTSVPGTGVVLTNILTSNAARGVGVLINEEFPSNPGGHGEPIINDPTPIYAPLRTVGTSENIDLPFNAYFMEYTSDIAAGNFKAVATFSIEYL